MPESGDCLIFKWKKEQEHNFERERKTNQRKRGMCHN